MFESHKIIEKAKRGAEERQMSKDTNEIQRALDRITQPLHRKSYATGDRQELGAEYQGFKVSIRYSEVSPENDECISVAQKHIVKNLPENSPALKKKTWKQLDQLLVGAQNAGQQNMLESVPDEYPILFCPSQPSSRPQGFISEKPKAIFYVGDIATVAGIAVLAHEIGHLHNEKLKPESERIRTTNERDQDVATIVLRERYANAFALKKLRSFITDPQDRKDVSILLREYGQGSYDTMLVNIQHARNMHEQAAFYAELRSFEEALQDSDVDTFDDWWAGQEGEEIKT